MKCLSERQGFFFPRSEAEETPGSSIFIRSDKRPKPGCDTISTARNAEAPQRDVELGLVQTVAGRTQVIATIPVAIEAIFHQQITLRRLHILSPAPEFLCHKFLSKTAKGGRDAPALASPRGRRFMSRVSLSCGQNADSRSLVQKWLFQPDSLL